MTAPVSPASSLRIVHVIESFAGGSIVLIILLARQLRDCEHIVIHGERSNEQAKEEVRRLFGDRVAFHHWRGAQREIHPQRDWQAYADLRSQLAGLRFEVLHLHCAKAGFLGRLAARSLGIDAVIYSPQAAPFLRKDISSWKRALFVRLERWANRMSGRVVATSASEQEAFQREGIPALCIPNGVEMPETAPPPPPASRQKPIRVVTVGRLTPQKNPLQFARIAEIFSEDERIAFEWIGDGEMRKEVASEAFTISGWLSQTEVHQRVRQAHIYLSTALWEGLPFAVLEAMSLSKPLLLRDCVGNRDCVDSRRNGFLFDRDEEAIAHLQAWIQTPEALEAMGEASWAVCRERYHISDIGACFRKLYGHLASHPSAKALPSGSWNFVAMPPS